MKRTIIAFVLVCLVSLSAWASEKIDQPAPSDPFSAIPGTAMTAADMESADGSLRIFGIEISPRIRRISRKKTTTRPKAVHCDIIAQNRADDLGLNTESQSGTSVDYNNATVADIYAGYPDSRYAEPPEGTAGYYFTAYGDEKAHMGAYRRANESSTYTRYSNKSFPDTESSYEAESSYVPEDVTAQSFVPLPEYEYYDLYYR